MAENKNIDNNKLASESHNRKKENYNNFFNSFDDEYKLIKVKYLFQSFCIFYLYLRN